MHTWNRQAASKEVCSFWFWIFHQKVCAKKSFYILNENITSICSNDERMLKWVGKPFVSKIAICFYVIFIICHSVTVWCGHTCIFVLK